MRSILNQNRTAERKFNKNVEVFGEKIGLIGKLFGCWHKDLSRPFTIKNSSYRVCLDCGARKRFDAENLRTFGPFYYPPATSLDLN